MLTHKQRIHACKHFQAFLHPTQFKCLPRSTRRKQCQLSSSQNCLTPFKAFHDPESSTKRQISVPFTLEAASRTLTRYINSIFNVRSSSLKRSQMLLTRCADDVNCLLVFSTRLRQSHLQLLVLQSGASGRKFYWQNVLCDFSHFVDHRQTEKKVILQWTPSFSCQPQELLIKHHQASNKNHFESLNDYDDFQLLSRNPCQRLLTPSSTAREQAEKSGVSCKQKEVANSSVKVTTPNSRKKLIKALEKNPSNYRNKGRWKNWWKILRQNFPTFSIHFPFSAAMFHFSQNENRKILLDSGAAVLVTVARTHPQLYL